MNQGQSLIRNPVREIFQTETPLVYLHTHEVTREILDQAIATRKSLELDISINPDGEIYIGHPLAMYTFHGLPKPRNLPLDTVLAKAQAADLFLMFDVKDVRVLPRVQQAITAYGADRCILHACVQELVFKPFSKKLIVEPSWEDEQLPLEPVLAVKRATGVPLALCSRGLSGELLANQGEDAVTQTILEVVEGNGEVFVPNFPKDELVPLSMLQALLEHGILSLFNVDRRPVASRPPVYFGSTDDIAWASVI